MPKKKKQAVLLIHGIGEQRPMDTLRKFVDAVWTTDTAIHHPYAKAGVFSKPDEISGNFELRRLTTTQNKKGVRTDFYEFYWAHLMQGNAVSHVVSWAKDLILRWPWKVPRRLLGVWILLVTLLLSATLLAAQKSLPQGYAFDLPWYLTGAVSFALALLIKPIISNVLGDAARYLHPAPHNIQKRQEIRTKGVALLKKLHDADQYDRIVIVGHSLGSVIAYDILSYAWTLYHEKINRRKAHPTLDEMEAFIAEGQVAPDVFQQKQRSLMKEMNANGLPWLVTDLITLGSPLTHSEILLARDKMDLKSKQTQRELPTCPPKLDDDRFSYPPGHVHRVPHHAAAFGFTRWTNVYFSSVAIVFGDMISGPLRQVFGPGIKDVRTKTTQRLGLMSHTLYWKPSKQKNKVKPHIAALRSALNLLDD
ncbi:MAG: hypothetical protein KI790_02620 [Cyclobacteriaceae bacterium]|nr:hypothetical protein [Cyclobacteriaceae bacterium HetDA_MAG_MS6]